MFCSSNCKAEVEKYLRCRFIELNVAMGKYENSARKCFFFKKVSTLRYKVTNRLQHKIDNLGHYYVAYSQGRRIHVQVSVNHSLKCFVIFLVTKQFIISERFVLSK